MSWGVSWDVIGFQIAFYIVEADVITCTRGKNCKNNNNEKKVYINCALYTTLPHNLIKDKLVDVTERTFQREGSLYIACNDRNAFFTSDAVRNYNL